MNRFVLCIFALGAALGLGHGLDPWLWAVLILLPVCVPQGRCGGGMERWR